MANLYICPANRGIYYPRLREGLMLETARSYTHPRTRPELSGTRTRNGIEREMPSAALYAKPWNGDHFALTVTVSRNGGCAMHGSDRCGRPATVTVVFAMEKNGACEDWIREHPEVDWRPEEP
jgi:hypothetical protein